MTKGFGPFFVVLSSVTKPQESIYGSPQALLTNTLEFMRAFFKEH